MLGLDASSLGGEKFSELLLDFVRFGEPVVLQFRKDLFPVEEDFKRTAFSWDDGHAARELLVIIVEEVLRQTGGSSKVTSRGAVFDPYRRSRLSTVGRRYACHVGVSSR